MIMHGNKIMTQYRSNPLPTVKCCCFEFKHEDLKSTPTVRRTSVNKERAGNKPLDYLSEPVGRY